MINDTIAAISTPLGEGGIGIVRVSGDEAVDIAKKVFVPAKEKEWWKNKGYRLYYGHVIEPDSKDIIDEALLGVMRAPFSYTREDIVEFNCHGGVVSLRKILEILLQQGARLAEPGEFSRRAFINGRLDLAQAEAIIDIIRAKTDVQLKLAMSQLKGNLSEKINDLQKKLIDLLALLEAVIDFPEDVEQVQKNELEESVKDILNNIEELLISADKGKIYRDGIWVVIAGRPNVGKSSLLNSFLKEKRAIVTDVPGTTRDVIEEIINLNGIPVKIADTAGLRHTKDLVEILGVEKTKELMEVADIILVLFDASEGLTEEDKKILREIEKRNVILIINKIDVADGEETVKEVKKVAGGKPVLKISALTGEGVQELEEKITEMVLGGSVITQNTLLISNVRHKNALYKAREYLYEALTSIKSDLPEDLIVVDLKAAWGVLGEVTGVSVTEEIIDRIFENFCIGK